MEELLVVKKINNAEELIDHLRMSHPCWRGPAQSWGFRGQADETWRLLPSAFRDTFRDYLPIGRRSKESEEKAAQNWNEFYAFEDFARLADEIGVNIPGNEFLLRVKFDEDKHLIHSYWPYDFPELVEGLAVAQHHGVPTRLMDFTYNPLVAAYFAAYDCIQNHKEEGYFRADRFSIWAVNLFFLRLAWVRDERRPAIRIVEVPTARNHFLNAQRGFFLFDNSENTNWPPLCLDELILAHAQKQKVWQDIEEISNLREQDCPKPPVIIKLDVLASEARKMLEILYTQERISQAHLMVVQEENNGLVDLIL